MQHLGLLGPLCLFPRRVAQTCAQSELSYLRPMENGHALKPLSTCLLWTGVLSENKMLVHVFMQKGRPMPVRSVFIPLLIWMLLAQITYAQTTTATVEAAVTSETQPAADGQAPAAPIMCPVMTDEEIDPNIFVMYKGQKVLLCCQKCRRKFLAEPEKYVANIQGFNPSLISDASTTATAAVTS